MRTVSPALIAFLNTSTEFIMVDLFTFVLKNGVTLRYSTAGTIINFGGFNWLPAPAGLTRSKVRWVTGVEVDTLDVSFPADESIVVNSIPMLRAAVLGMFDNAKVTLSRLYMSDWNTPVDSILLFTGNVAKPVIQRTVLHLTIKSDLDKLNMQMPQNLYQSACLHTLYDIGCAVNVNTYMYSGTVTTVTSNAIFGGTGSFVDGYFQMGAVKFTSGANEGLTRTVKSYLSGVIYATNPFPFDVQASDSFILTPGCDKLRNGDCANKYNNVINFKGFEYIPVPETAA
jgi:uncharacterized phage protein (TIGR02218 family)